MSVTIEQVRDYLRYDSTDDDGALGIMLAAGINWVERHSGILMTEREVTEASNLPPVTYLRWAPYKTDSLSIEYLDGSLSPHFIESFNVQKSGRVLPNTSWPSTRGATLTYTAGFADPDDVPDSLIHAVCIYCALSDQERGAVSDAGWETLRHVLGDYWRPVIA